MRILVAICVVVAAACGDNLKGPSDAGVDSGMPDGRPAACGNFELETGEDCDDGNREADLICDENCRFTCGNGQLDTAVGEACDTAIASGAGSCPRTYNDNDACTTDALAGSECAATCEFSPITAPIDGDGCCPDGANANTDDDCTAMCGNGILEAGELCDTGITMGIAGSCPTTCDDSESCTTDTLISANTCQAQCVFTPITTNTPSDGCCRPGTTPQEDNDCVGCGDGVVGAGETCDIAIATGPGSCPTTCTDADACTANLLNNAGTCTAACAFPPITAPANGDGCCPTGANANNDNDCQPVCPNGVVEAGEQCDDGNLVDTDACTNNCTRAPTAFRFDTLALRDPHAFAQVFIFCADITNSASGSAINEQFATNLTTDTDMDGFLQLSPVVVFRPLNQAAAVTSPVELQFADCTAPNGSTTMCAHDPATTPVPLMATNQSTGTCLGPIAGTVRPYTPAVTTTTAPAGGTCFVSTNSSVTFTLAGVDITLTDAQIAGAYQGNPATRITNGLLRGFLSEAVAYTIILPADLAVVGGMSLGSLLRGGQGNCQSGSDLDMNGTTPGWWFYLNYTATARPWTD